MAFESTESDGITVSSNVDSAETLASTLAPDPTPEPAADAGEPAPVDPTATVDKPAKPRNDPKARVEAATAKEAAAKRERDEAKTEAAALKARIAELEARTAPKPEPPKPAPVAAADPEPTVDQFDSYEKFVKAQARWEARAEMRQQQMAAQQQQHFEQRARFQHEVNQKFGERYTAILAEDPEFPTKVDQRLLNTPRLGVLADPRQATFGNFLIEQVFQSEQPKALLLHLSDPAVVQRLATLPPNQVIRELAKFEARQTAASPAGPAVPTPPVSHAKPPIKPVGSSPVAADPDEVSDDLSVDEHIRRMNAKDRRERRAS